MNLHRQRGCQLRRKPLSKLHVLVMCLCAQTSVFAGDDVDGLATGNAAKTGSVVNGSAVVTPQFNRSLLAGGKGKTDISRFEKGDLLTPGEYRVDIYVNEAWLGRRDLRIVPIPNTDQTQICITKSLLIQMGLDFTLIPMEAKEALRLIADTNACFDLEKYIPGSKLDFDLGDLRLQVSIPQIYVGSVARGYVAPEEWEDGVNAGFLRYYLNAFQNQGETTDRQFFANLDLGMNIAGWRLRHSGTFSTGGKSQLDAKKVNWKPINTFVEHDVTALKSQLTLGETYTKGELFDSIRFSGIQLASDERMLPESQRGYAPVIRGVAETNARVTVRQGGNIIREISVPPGEFKIDDMYASGYAGDFFVTITEADGRQKQFTMPYVLNLRLLRSGTSNYSISLGRVKDVNPVFAPRFAQATYQLGLKGDVTAYGGAIASEKYAAAELGLAMSTSLGSVSIDQSRSSTKGIVDLNTMRGSSWRVAYNKVIDRTNTNFSVAGYRFSSRDFFTFNDATQLFGSATSQGSNALFRPRQRLQFNVSQPLGEGWGSLYASAYLQSFWNGFASNVSYQASYSNNFSGINVGMSVAKTKDMFGKDQTQISLSVSVPLGAEGRAIPPRLSANLNHNAEQDDAQIALAGNFNGGQDGEEANLNSSLNYNLYTNASRGSFSGKSSRQSYGAGLQYNTPWIQGLSTFSSGVGYRQASLGANGALVVHRDGILFSNGLGDITAIVQAPGAEGATLVNGNGARINHDGYALAPYLTPYARNEISIDPKGSPLDVEIESTSQQAVPRAGAIMLLKFSTTVGRAALLTIKRGDGTSVPVGATVLNATGTELGLIAQGGRIFTRGLASTGTLTVQWGENSERRCFVDYALDSARVDADDGSKDKQKSGQPYQNVVLSCSREE